jgi:hypothetical protein
LPALQARGAEAEADGNAQRRTAMSMVAYSAVATGPASRSKLRPKVFAKAFELQGRRSTVPTEAELNKINRFSRVALTAEQVYVGECDLCSSRVDRVHERFPEDVLRDFARSLPGKSLMAGHDHESLPLGLWFDARLRRGEDGTSYLHPSYYIVKTAQNEHERAQIDGGVYRYASIGFQAEDLVCDICGKSWFGYECEHSPGEEYEVDGKRIVATAHYTRSDEHPAEAVEGSIVWLGCQYDAEMKAIMTQKAFDGIVRPRGGDVEVKAMNDAGAKPYPNEHSCRLRDPDDFQDGSFRRVTRRHEGKEYGVIMGRLVGEDTMTEQAYRYGKDTWSADEAQSHCEAHDGSFEAASRDAAPEPRAKGAIPYRDEGKADEDEGWDAAHEQEIGWGKGVEHYRRMHAWYDAENPDLKGSYKLPHHRGGDLKAVWRGVAAAAVVVQGGRGGVDITDVEGVKAHLAKHYREFDKPVPWESDAGPEPEPKAVSGGKVGRELSQANIDEIEARLEQIRGGAEGIAAIVERAKERYGGDAALAPKEAPKENAGPGCAGDDIAGRPAAFGSAIARRCLEAALKRSGLNIKAEDIVGGAAPTGGH